MNTPPAKTVTLKDHDTLVTVTVTPQPLSTQLSPYLNLAKSDTVPLDAVTTLTNNSVCQSRG